MYVGDEYIRWTEGALECVVDIIEEVVIIIVRLVEQFGGGVDRVRLLVQSEGGSSQKNQEADVGDGESYELGRRTPQYVRHLDRQQQHVIISSDYVNIGLLIIIQCTATAASLLYPKALLA